MRPNIHWLDYTSGTPKPLKSKRRGVAMKPAPVIQATKTSDLDLKQESPSVAGVAAGCGLQDDGLPAQAAADSGGSVCLTGTRRDKG